MIRHLLIVVKYKEGMTFWPPRLIQLSIVVSKHKTSMVQSFRSICNLDHPDDFPFNLFSSRNKFIILFPSDFFKKRDGAMNPVVSNHNGGVISSE